MSHDRNSHGFYFAPDVHDDHDGDLDALEENREVEEEEEDEDASPPLSPVDRHTHWPQSYRQSMDIWTSPNISSLFSPMSNKGNQPSYLSPYPSWRRRTPHMGEEEPFLPPSTRVVPTRLEHPKDHPPPSRPHAPPTSQQLQQQQQPDTDDAIHYIEMRKRTGSSFFQAMLIGVNILAGVGVLSTPYAVMKGGWLSLLILFALAAICCYTGLVLKYCLESQPLGDLETYPDIGEAAFGRTGRFLISIILYAELYACCVEFLILEGDNLAALFPNAGMTVFGFEITATYFFILLSSLFILPTVWLRDLSLLSYISAGGVIASIVVLFCVWYVGAEDGIGFNLTGKLINFSGLPVSIGLFGFCYSGHAVFPNIYSSMAEPKHYDRVLQLSFLFCTLIYAGMAITGYLMFGSSTETQITLNLPTQYVASQIAMWTTVVNPFTKFAVTMMPVALSLEELLPLNPFSSSYLFSSLFIRTCLVISTVCVAILVPFFAYVMAFIGSFLSMTVSVILPCACYLKILGHQLPLSQIVICYSIIMIGVICVIFGTYSSLLGIVSSLSSS